MDPELYKAVKNGNVQYLDQRTDLFDNQVTQNHSNILHVAAQFGNKDCVAKILEKKPCNLIRHVNLKGENPLHIAIKDQHYGADQEKREYYYSIVKQLIEGAAELEQDLESSVPAQLQILRATNVDGDTPLHLAVRGGESKVVSLLAYTDADFQHIPNKAKETPLYLAAERNNGDFMVESILACCESPTCTGPYDRTALHAAVISGNIVSIKKLLEKNEAQIEEADEQGWTPLHYAVYRQDKDAVKELLERNKEVINKTDTQGWTPLHHATYLRDKNAVKELLTRNKLAGYKRAEKHDKGIALHIAAEAGYEDVMEVILSHCPDCWEMVNGEGQNILHIAVYREAELVIDYIIKNGMLESLMNQKDIKGNTPLHLLASSKMKNIDDIINHPRANMYAVNNQGKTPAELAMSIKEDNTSLWSSKARGLRNISSNEEERAKMAEERKESTEVIAITEAKAKADNKASQSLMLVAILIATITFASGFAIPGGYKTKGPEEGMAVLVREAGFKAFILANTIAVVCSTSSALVFAIAILYDDGDKMDDGDKQAGRYMFAFCLVLAAVVAMMVGFLSGTYAMLVDCLGLAIATSTIAGISFLIYFWEVIGFIIYIWRQ